MNTVRQMTALLWLSLCGACEAETVHNAEIVLSQIKLGQKSTLAGFACSTSDGRLTSNRSRALLARAFTASEDNPDEVTLSATVVLDYVALGGYPRCRATEIANYCSEEGNECKPVASRRVCLDLEPLDIPVETFSAALTLIDTAGAVFADYVKERLAGELVTRDAPNTEAILRLVGTTESCDELEARDGLDFDSERLLGCSYSCPLVPSAARGEILLDFEGVGPCERDVITCAGDSFAPRSQRDVPGIIGSRSP